MAVSTTSFFSGSKPGDQRQLMGIDSQFDKHTKPKHAIGTQMTTIDGRGFRYAHFGADTNAGLLVSQDLSESSLLDVDIVAPASANTTTDGTIGSKFVQATEAAVTANQFAGGYLSTEDDTGEGFTYFIKGNTATNDPVTGDIRIELVDPIQVAVVAATTGNILGSQYANLEAANTTDIAASGVSCSTMDVSDKAYGWVQTKGIATVGTDGTLVIGSGCIIAADAGELAPAVETDILERVGVCYQVAADTEHSVVKLTLE
jgi:hypothetical protein